MRLITMIFPLGHSNRYLEALMAHWSPHVDLSGNIQHTPRKVSWYLINFQTSSDAERMDFFVKAFLIISIYFYYIVLFIDPQLLQSAF